MKRLMRRRKRVPRKLRFFLDVFLTLALLFVFLLTREIPAVRDDTRFRREEKANLAGPSEILDLFHTPAEWAVVGYARLLVADAGDEILFCPLYTNFNGYGTLYRREKTDGILLTTPPAFMLGSWDLSVAPLFLFADDPAAVRAEVQLRLSEDFVLELSQVRGADAPDEERDQHTRERFFWFDIPMPENSRSKQRALLRDLWDTNSYTANSAAEFPATIRLYDKAGDLLEEREYVVRSRAMETAARAAVRQGEE